jgi:hypothetical protein
MKRLILLTLLFSQFSFGQNRSELWLSAGVKREIKPHWVASIGTNARIRHDGKLQTLFQDVGIKSEHLSWFRPSIEYRLITSFDKLGNYSFSNRLNFNLDFRYSFDALKVGTRIRYQAFIGKSTISGGDLDPSLRIKPYVTYTFSKSRIQPEFSTEFFYNPVYGPNGRSFNRVRFGLTANIDLPGSNDCSITYYYGRKFNTGNPYQEHLLSLEYGFEWKKAKKKSE